MPVDAAKAAALSRRFLLGSSTPEEEAELDAVLAEDPLVGAGLLAQVQEAFENVPPASLSADQWAEAAAVLKTLAKKGRRGRAGFRLGRRMVLGIAAVLVLTAGGWFFG